MLRRQAEIAGEYLRKGRPVFIEGSLQTREWTDKEGNKRYTTEVRAQRLQLLGRPDDRGGSGGGGAPAEDAGEPAGAFADDDIPF